MQDTKPNFPVVGGEYKWTGNYDEGWRSRVERIDADGMVHYRFLLNGVAQGNLKTTSIRAFSNHYYEDQSPIPALVKVLKAIQFKGHNQVCPICKGNENIGHSAMCDIGLALALAGESEKESDKS